MITISPKAGGYVSVGQEVFRGTLTTAAVWQDLDLSAYVGPKKVLCKFEVTALAGGGGLKFCMKPRGAGGTVIQHNDVWGTGSITLTGGYFGYMICETDSDGFVEIAANFNTETMVIRFLGSV